MTPPDRWREAAREAAAEIFNMVAALHELEPDYLRTFAKIIERRLFPAREEGWISVEEGLHVPGVEVLVLTTPNRLRRVMTWSGLQWECRIHRDDPTKIGYLEPEHVTHWQTLPTVSTESERQKEERDGK